MRDPFSISQYGQRCPGLLSAGFSLLCMAGLLLLSACNSADLSFVNEVKRFEPRWMGLSEKVAFVNRNLGMTQRRYEQDFKEVSPSSSDAGTEVRTQLYSLRAEYRTVVTARDSIQVRFDEHKARFTTVVNEFNAWQSKVMKNQLDPQQAQSDFDRFLKEYESLRTAFDEMQSDIISNIGSHNSIMAQMTKELGMYSNYIIDVK